MKWTHRGAKLQFSKCKKWVWIYLGDILDIGLGSLPSFPENEEVIGIITTMLFNVFCLIKDMGDGFKVVSLGYSDAKHAS
jgi:hypothetical protein